MINTLKLYDGDTFLRTIPFTNPNVQGDAGSAVAHQATFETGIEYYQHLKPRGRRVEIGDGEKVVFAGFVDGKRIRPQENMITVPCRDDGRRAKTQFPATKVYGDPNATETVIPITSASASSELPPGAPVQFLGKLYEKQLYVSIITMKTVTVEGTYYDTETSPIRSTDAGDPCAGDYSVTGEAWGWVAGYSWEGFIDLQKVRDIASVVLTSNGSASAQTSSDGQTWVPYAPNTSWRFLKVHIGRDDLPITLGVVVTSGVTSNAVANILTDDGDAYLPAASDAHPVITLNFAQGNASALDLRWGLSDADKTSRYHYKVEGIKSDGTLQTLEDDASATPAYLAECPFDTANIKGLKITVLSATGPIALRSARVRNVVSTATVDSVIREMLTEIGQTKFDLIRTMQVVKSFIGERGHEVIADATSLAESNGLILRWKKDGTAWLFRADDWDLSKAKTLTALDKPEFERSDEAVNTVVGVNDGLNLVSTAVDENPASLTSTVNADPMTVVVAFPLADTQQKLDAATRAKLAELNKNPASGSFEVEYDPDTEVYDLVRLKLDKADVDGVFVVEGYTSRLNPATAEEKMALRVREVL